MTGRGRGQLVLYPLPQQLLRIQLVPVCYHRLKALGVVSHVARYLAVLVALIHDLLVDFRELLRGGLQLLIPLPDVALALGIIWGCSWGCVGQASALQRTDIQCVLLPE